MKFLLVLIPILFTACGTAQDMVDPFDAEVKSVAPGLQNSNSSYWNLTFNEGFNQMHENEWYGVAAVSPDQMPKDCNDGMVYKALLIDYVILENLEPGHHYFVRFCAQGPHKTSTGITHEFDFNPE